MASGSDMMTPSTMISGLGVAVSKVPAASSFRRIITRAPFSRGDQISGDGDLPVLPDELDLLGGHGEDVLHAVPRLPDQMVALFNLGQLEPGPAPWRSEEPRG